MNTPLLEKLYGKYNIAELTYGKVHDKLGDVYEEYCMLIFTNKDFLSAFQKNDEIDSVEFEIFKKLLTKAGIENLIVTSPPYNLDIAYKSCDDAQPYNDYLKFTKDWLKRCLGWLKQDGRMCLNIPLDKNKGGHQSVGPDIIEIAKNIGYKYHATIIWNEGNISKSSAWGSWLSASCPYVIAPVELIVVL